MLVSLTQTLAGAHTSLEAVMYEMVSAVGTVGVSMGITPDLEPLSKVLVIITMFCGRVGIFTLTSALTSLKTRPLVLHYPEAHVGIG